MNLGWIGTGVMGASMAGHLQRAGHRLTIYTRSREKAAALLAGGATWAASPAAVAAESEVVFTIVGYPKDVEECYYGAHGILSQSGCATRGCRMLIDMTTSPPSLAQRLAVSAQAKGLASLDAPVSGGDLGARNAALAIMVGGDQASYDSALPLFQLMGKNIALMGGPGAGQHTKMCNQILIAGTMIGVCESLLYAARQGLDQQAVIEIIGKGAASSWAINNLGPRIVKGDYQPGFFVEHFVKDMEIALRECEALNLALPGLALVHQLFLALKAQGDARLGTQALILALRRLNGQA
jgi:3-hydroxyisobutyrate dehydrogenase